ncbi:MAG: LysR family transcriptional regulator [Spirochaetaceae bacterium]|nr:LysR family transcriptional regulator [Spirochaetaceae bacterium]|tara:strand:- start:3961 stop:4416 length:456 start_codon:yes stop_codon:yes gene_type:complete
MVREKLKELGLELPVVNPPVASYVPAKRIGNQVFISGQLPVRDGKLILMGQLKTDDDVEAAQAAMAQCFLNGLAALSTVADLDSIKQLVRLGAFVSSSPDFHGHHIVANGASNLAQQILGQAGIHSRAAVGVAALPLNAAVELEMLFEVQD